MSFFVHLLAGPVAHASLIVFGAFAAAAAGLTGPERAAFMDSSTRECMREALGNKTIPAAVTTQFCNCYSKEMADGMSNAELKSFEEMGEEKATAALETKMDAAGERCAKRLKLPKK